MRVISQDGTIDVPYEQVIIQQYKGKIYFLNKNLTGVEQLVNDMDIATYSTEEKAKKAMEMLRKAWKFETGIYHRNIIFQFPQDSEIEV